MKKKLLLIIPLVLFLAGVILLITTLKPPTQEEEPVVQYNYNGKVISILGDSISTFDGYIPVDDGFNLAHRARYPQDNLLTEVNETWWMQVLTAFEAKLGINDSWAGSRISNGKTGNSGDQGEDAAMASLTRIKNLGSNGTPDVILFFGGTNDIGGSVIVGSFSADTAPAEVDLTTTKWYTAADAYVAAITRMQYFYPDAQIFALLPTYTTGYYSDTKLAQYNEVFAAICQHYKVPYIDLRECGITTDNMPDGIHPNAAGMDFISTAVIKLMTDNCTVPAKENVVHTVTHNLVRAEASLGYFKGISDGSAFSETLIADDSTVSVVMGGVDITATVYQNGTITIPAVTGDLVISATGKEKPIYADYLKEIPANLCKDTNLWTMLEHDNVYYTGSGWGKLSGYAVYSVTIPVSGGDQIWATSFQAYGLNGNVGGNVSGIRVTWFNESGVLASISPKQIFNEFTENGYITAPAGATAVNITMWDNSDTNELYILNREHSYVDGACTACGAEN